MHQAESYNPKTWPDSRGEITTGVNMKCPHGMNVCHWIRMEKGKVWPPTIASALLETLNNKLSESGRKSQTCLPHLPLIGRAMAPRSPSMSTNSSKGGKLLSIHEQTPAADSSSHHPCDRAFLLEPEAVFLTSSPQACELNPLLFGPISMATS